MFLRSVFSSGEEDVPFNVGVPEFMTGEYVLTVTGTDVNEQTGRFSTNFTLIEETRMYTFTRDLCELYKSCVNHST